MIMQGGETFFWPGGKHGVLLIHGFTGVPAELQLLGEHLHNAGYTVLCMRLAGHGTTSRDMARMSWQDWYHSACDGYSILSSCCDRISVAGLSMGGLLAMLLAANTKVAHCISMAAPIYIHEDRQMYRLPPRELAKGLYEPKGRRRLVDIPEGCNAAYREMPLESIYELLDGIEELKKALPLIKCPHLIIHSKRDHTADPRSAEYIYRNSGSQQKELRLLEESGHMVTLDIEREKVFDMVEEFLGRV